MPSGLGPVLITGCSSGLGQAVARAFRNAGHLTIATARKAETLAPLTAIGCEALPLDVTDEASRSAAVAETERRFGPIGVLINNAGCGQYGPLEEISPELLQRSFEINVFGLLRMSQLALPGMRRAGCGRIVNISSLGGLRPWAEHAHYCASKAGVIMLTRALAKAFAPEITVNSVAPGVIPFGEWNEAMTAMLNATPAGRVGTGEEIADAVVYFLRASNFVTGQIMAVDGGLSQR